MDDDIDIEEHDVMDNPRIKSIFPDLSRVKIEIPDGEDIVEEQYSDTPTEQPQEMLYQYEYSFETTTEDTQGESEEFGEENTSYLYNNEIILGTKPPVTPDALYEEALNSHPVVYLENWKEKLQCSPCFCNTCEILFPTVNALDAHKMISHSYLIAMDTTQRNTARKSTVPSKYCNHCSKTFPDDTSLIKHLYELLPLNNFPKIKEEIPEPEIVPKVPKFTSKPMQLPKKIKSTSHVITKIHPKKIKLETKDIKIEPETEVKKVKSKLGGRLQRDGKFFAASSLVPKSTLFLCKICQTGFLSCFSASQHSKYCEKLLPFNKCEICKRKIRTKDAKIHALQHNYNDKLKIYTINKSIYERVLCKCPKCLSCFDELGFWAHYQKCKSEKKSTYCSDCDVSIASSRYQSHRLKHSIKKLTKKDFIVVEFYDQNNIKLISEDVIEETRSQRLKERNKKYRERKSEANKYDNDITLYYCEFCGCCQYILNYKGHTDGTCKNKNIDAKKYCEKCGLCFSTKSIESHLVLHEKRSFSLKDINIISLTTGKTIEPPMSELYKCEKCSKHFIYRRNLNLHKCKTEKYVTCKICMKKFNLQAYKIHKIFHSADKLMPELMKKYNSIKSMWNIMYMCASCELVTMSYDSAVTHSQGHLNYIISDLQKHCVVCDLQIAEKEFLLHEKLHTNNESIGRASFKILKYNYEDLFKKEWLLLFKYLPKQHRQQILSKSIFRYTRSVKMQIEIKAATDDTKYFCMNCNNFVDGTTINQHVKSNCLRNNKYVCSTCHEIFKSLKQFLSHEGSHEKVPYTIVSFNNECDKEFNNHLSLIALKSKKDKKSLAIKKPDVPLSKLREILLADVKKTYKLYKCAKCGTCVSLKSSINRHRCGSDSERRFCEICAQYFSSKKFPMHMEAHKKKPYITKNSFYVVHFNCEEKTAKIPAVKDAKVSPTKDIAKIFECQCGLHFTSMKTIEKHLDECSPDLDVSKETCSKCKLVFPTEVLVTHLINHHHKATKIVIERIIMVNLLRCVHCSIYFTNMDSYNMHTENCNPKNGAWCKNCRLTFGRQCFSKHLCSTGNTTYINKVTMLKKVVKQTMVYKCVPCDITYLKRNSFRYHYYEVNHNLKKPPVTCVFCGLKFTKCSYQKHIRIHNFRSGDYKIKVLDPISGDFEFVTGNNGIPKIDGDDDFKRSSPRKRKFDNLAEEIDSCSVKKVKNDNETKHSEKKSGRTNVRDKPSTSKDTNIDFDETPSEIVPDISQDNVNITNNDTDIDTSDILPDKDNDSIEKTVLSNKLKSRIIVKGYGKNLYRCVYCNQHYMKESSFDYHAKNHRLHEISENYKCDICELDFSKYTLPRHKYVHHDNMGLKKEDFVILTETVYSKESEIWDRIEKLKAKNNSNVEILDSSSEIRDNITETNENANTLVPSELNVSDICDTNSDITDIVSEIDKIIYYKCSDCNVCFVDQKMCFEHTLKHEILDPKTYIQCKICDFQFLIDSLKEHMNLHHNTDFMIESLTIHEYKPLKIGIDPKIDIYQAVDKVQSRLVSTTTDVGVV